MNSLLSLVKKYAIPIAGFNIILMLVVGMLLSKAPSKWTANAKLILPTTTSDLNADLGKLGSLRGGGVLFSSQLNPLNILTSILLSDRTLVDVKELDPEKEKFSDLDGFRSLFEATPEPESTLISLTANGSSKYLAEIRLQRLIESFQEQLTSLRETDVNQRTNFMKVELEQASKRLHEAQKTLAEFRRSINLVDDQAQIQELVRTINSLSASQAQVMAEYQANVSQVITLSNRLDLTPEQAVKSLRLAEDQTFQSTKQRLNDLDSRLIEARSQFSDEHPEVMRLVDERRGLQVKLNTHINEIGADPRKLQNVSDNGSAALLQQLVIAESSANALHQRAKHLQSQVSRLESTLKTYPVAQQKLQDLQRQYQIAEGIHTGLLAKAQELRLNGFSSYPNVQVLDLPRVGSAPTGPRKSLIVLGAALTSIFGMISIVLFLEAEKTDEDNNLDLKHLKAFREKHNNNISFENSPSIEGLSAKENREILSENNNLHGKESVLNRATD